MYLFTTANPTSTSQDFTSTLPSSMTQSAAQAPTTPTPVYSGSHINSIPHVAQSVGANYNYDSASNTHTVNGQMVNPTSVVNGVPHAPVAAVAHAAGVPSQNVQPNSSGGVQVMSQASPQSAATNSTLNPYWSTVQQNGGMWMGPQNGESAAQAKQRIASAYGVDPNQIQVQSNGHAWVPFGAISNYAHSQPGGMAPQPAQPSYADQMQQMMNQYLGQINGSAPQAPQLQQIPTFDASSIQPFQFDANQDMANQYQAQLPQFQQQMASADQAINDSMNKRGMYNGGIAQENVNSQNQALYGKLFSTIQSGSLADQKQAFTEYQANVTNQLNAYKDNVDTMYKNGQLSNQQYSDAINVWKTQVGAEQNAMDQMGKQMMQSQSETFTAGQNDNKLTEDMAKAMLPYQSMTQYQQADMQFKVAQEQFNQWDKIQQLGQGQQKINAAANNAALSAQLRQEGIDLNSQKLSDAEKNSAIDQAIKQGQFSLSQTRLQYDATNSQLTAVTKQIDTFRSTNPNTTPPAQLTNQATALIQQLSQIASQMSGGGTTDSTFTPSHNFTYAN